MCICGGNGGCSCVVAICGTDAALAACGATGTGTCPGAGAGVGAWGVGCVIDGVDDNERAGIEEDAGVGVRGTDCDGIDAVGAGEYCTGAGLGAAEAGLPLLLTATGEGAPIAGDIAVLVAGVVTRDGGADSADTTEGVGCDG